MDPKLADALAEAEALVQATYTERNRCVAAIARMALLLGWRAGVGQHPEEDQEWDPEWRTIVYVETPTGQWSWHLPDSERDLVASLPLYSGEWDGHTTDQKYDRMGRMPIMLNGKLRCGRCTGQMRREDLDNEIVCMACGCRVEG